MIERIIINIGANIWNGNKGERESAKKKIS